jgi:hypothetical protein
VLVIPKDVVPDEALKSKSVFFPRFLLIFFNVMWLVVTFHPR